MGKELGMESKLEVINSLKKEINAVILVHNYQPPEIQDIADFTGDSLELSRKAAATDRDVIIFCGVDFMAETAKVLSPDKKVILPEKGATCPMANMVTAGDLKDFKKSYPGVPVVTYVNTTADVKAESDICCTSGNAVKVVSSIKENNVIFIPDRNLGHYVSTKVDKNIILMPGFCYVHDSIRVDEVKKTLAMYPEAVFMAHPECSRDVLELANYVASTGGMFEVVKNDSSKVFLVGTEQGMIYPLKKQFPDREFIPVRKNIICNDMKKITIDKVIKSMQNLSPEINISKEIIGKASIALNRMLEVS